MKIRLHQFLSKCGVFTSKKEVKEAIWNGDISVNGSIMKDMKFEFNPKKKIVCYRGQELDLPSENYYFLLHKPVGYICSRLNSQEKELGKKSVFEIFNGKISSKVYQSLITVGRLDEDTTGLLLVTTDGKLVEKITNPKNHIPKKYLVETELSITEEEMFAIKKGINIKIIEEDYTEEYWTRPAKIGLQDERVAVLTIDEGKKRQIRRMFDAMGNYVVAIHRLAIGKIELSEYDIKPGEFQKTSLDEIEKMVL